MPTYGFHGSKIVGRNVSKPGGNEQVFAIIKTRGGRNTKIDEYPSLDLASKMYQTHKHDLRETSKRSNGTVLKLQKMMKTSDNSDMLWTDETKATIKQTTIRPYTKIYSSRMRKIRGY